jgi:hypothetical protein
MADYASRDVNTSFKGLTTTVAIFGAVGSICLIGFETMRQMRRLPNVSFVPIRNRKARQSQGGSGVAEIHAVAGDENAIEARRKLSCEDWEMGHLYLARMFHAR